MPQARYILRLSDGELFPWFEPWLKMEWMVEYNPKVHGVRAEVAAQMGLVVPEASMKPAVVSEPPNAGDPVPANVATEPKAQAQPSDDDLSDVFAPR